MIKTNALPLCGAKQPPVIVRQFIMAVADADAYSRCGHYIFLPYVVYFFFLSSFFFPRLISAVGDWMSTILPHMVWSWCEFRMQV